MKVSLTLDCPYCSRSRIYGIECLSTDKWTTPKVFDCPDCSQQFGISVYLKPRVELFELNKIKENSNAEV